MSSIDTYLAQILSAKYGEDVRSAIYNSIKQCYADATDVSDVGTSLTTINTYISELQASIDSLYDNCLLTESLLDSSSSALLDSSGNELLGQVIFIDSITYQKLADQVASIESVVKNMLSNDNIFNLNEQVNDLISLIDEFQTTVDGIETLFTDGLLMDYILDSDGEKLLDSNGNPLSSQIIFVTMAAYQDVIADVAALNTIVSELLQSTDQTSIQKIQELFATLEETYSIEGALLDSYDEEILDSFGNALIGYVTFIDNLTYQELLNRVSGIESAMSKVDDVEDALDDLRADQSLYEPLLDSSGYELLDNWGFTLFDRVVLVEMSSFTDLKDRVSDVETEVASLYNANLRSRVTDLEIALSNIPTNPIDWSDAASLILPEPQCAIVNITGISTWPTSKLVDKKAWLEFWDCQGNYFKKRILISAQGSSSLNYVKKNASCDICNDEWEGDDTFSIKFGEWVEQDSFHFKAFYTDYFRGVGICSYHLMDEIVKTRGLYYDRPWKKALVDFDSIGTASNAFGGITDNALELDTGARNWPDGFPCIFYLNGDFYGIYTWQIKKHRDNFHMTKDEATHIWLDGTINATTLLGGTPDWTSWEVRNPKNLYLMDGTEYDADTNIGELIDDTSEYYSLDSDSSKVAKRKKTTAKVKAYIIALSNVMATIQEAKTAYEAAGKTDEALATFREVFETYFDIENQIDYLILMDVIRNGDAFSKNWQWATYDGVKWYLCPYDLDQSFGADYRGDRIAAPLTSHINNSSDRPSYYVIHYYLDELKARYAELRDAGIIDVEHIVGLVNTWTKRIGLDMYENEFDKWSDCMCHGETVLNDGWELIEGKMGTSSTYDETAAYAEGDTCTYGLSSHMGYFTFQATTEVTGVAPVKTWKHHDSIWRVRKWLVKQISNLDTLYGYSAS